MSDLIHWKNYNTNWGKKWYSEICTKSVFSALILFLDLMFTNFVAIFLENLNYTFDYMAGGPLRANIKKVQSRSSTKQLNKEKLHQSSEFGAQGLLKMKQTIFIKESTLWFERDVNKKIGASLKKILWNYQAYRNRYVYLIMGIKRTCMYLEKSPRLNNSYFSFMERFNKLKNKFTFYEKFEIVIYKI